MLYIHAQAILNTAAKFVMISWVVTQRGPTYPSMFCAVSVLFTTVLDSLLLGHDLSVGRYDLYYYFSTTFLRLSQVKHPIKKDYNYKTPGWKLRFLLFCIWHDDENYIRNQIPVHFHYSNFNWEEKTTMTIGN